MYYFFLMFWVLVLFLGKQKLRGEKIHFNKRRAQIKFWFNTPLRDLKFLWNAQETKSDIMGNNFSFKFWQVSLKLKNISNIDHICN